MLYRPKQASFPTKTSLLQKLRYTAAASEAHMNDCIMPVITNFGNETHEIVSSLAAIIYKRGKRSGKEQHYRMPALSHLLIIHQKTFIGILSAFCVVVNAMAATQNAPSHFLAGVSPDQIKKTLINSFTNVRENICDGVKVSCAAKIPQHPTP